MNITFDDYVKAVKLKYEEVKNGSYYEYLLHPSPGQLRKLCVFFYDNGLDATDDIIFRKFFNANKEDDLGRNIERFDVDKFRSIKNFLIGKSDTTSLINVNLIAVLIDFNPRPLRIFLTQATDKTATISSGVPSTEMPHNPEYEKEAVARRVKRKEGIIDAEVISEENGIEVREEFTFTPTTVPDTEIDPSTNNWKLVAASIAVMLLFSFATKNAYFPDDQCMQWQTDHYEAVACDKVKAKGENEIIALNDSILEMKKIKLTDPNQYQKNGKIIAWYSKQDNQVEFFDRPGYHPTNYKKLRQVTPYIAMKYYKRPDQKSPSTPLTMMAPSK